MLCFPAFHFKDFLTLLICENAYSGIIGSWPIEFFALMQAPHHNPPVRLLLLSGSLRLSGGLRSTSFISQASFPFPPSGLLFPGFAWPWQCPCLSRLLISISPARGLTVFVIQIRLGIEHIAPFVFQAFWSLYLPPAIICLGLLRRQISTSSGRMYNKYCSLTAFFMASS